MGNNKSGWKLFQRKSRRKTGLRALSRRLRVECLEPRMMLSSVTWKGGGPDNRWGDPANWPNNTLPASGDDVIIGSGATVAPGLKTAAISGYEMA
jgi:hypothetical protein